MCLFEKCFALVIFAVGFSSVLSATVLKSENGTMCRENCDNSGISGDGHVVVKKESPIKMNFTEVEKNVEGEFFDALLSAGKSNRQTENTIETQIRGARMLQDNGARSLKSNTFTARSPKRKIWMAALAGIVLKLASLLPLILGKLSLIGTVALLTSKLSLLIVTIIVLKSMFSSDKGHSYPEAAFTSPGHQGYQDYGQSVTGYPISASANHRRWAYYRQGVGRELGSWEEAQEENKQ